MFWPRDDSLALVDSSPGFAPVGIIAIGFAGSLAVYNVLYFLAFAVAFAGAFAFARELGISRGGAAVGGAIFAFAPWRVAQATHLHVLWSGGIPFALFLFTRGMLRRRPWAVFAGWCVAAWQLSVGLALGIQLAYLLAGLAVAGFGLWLRAGRPRPSRGVIAATVAGSLLFAGVGVARAVPYVETSREPGAIRSEFEISSLSPFPHSFLIAPRDNAVWGPITRPLREGLRSQEQALFLGLTAIVLAVLGIGSPTFHRGLRIGLVAAVGITAALALGLHESLGRFQYLLPYKLLYEFAPGWQGVRAPGRIVVLTTLAIALLAAAGADRLCRRAVGRRRQSLIGATLAMLVIVEGLPSLGYPVVPPVPQANTVALAPQLHLPFLANDSLYLLWSVEGFPQLVNGVASFPLADFEHLRRELEPFPSGETVRRLRTIGVRSVVLHEGLAVGGPWERADRKPIAGLPLRRVRIGDEIVFQLRKSP